MMISIAGREIDEDDEQAEAPSATAPDSGVTKPSTVHAHRHMAFLNFAASSDPPVASPAL